MRVKNGPFANLDDFFSVDRVSDIMFVMLT